MNDFIYEIDKMQDQYTYLSGVYRSPIYNVTQQFENTFCVPSGFAGIPTHNTAEEALTCCFQDLDHLPIDSARTFLPCLLYDNTTPSNMCQPEFRSITDRTPPGSSVTGGCRNLVKEYCSVADNADELLSRWNVSGSTYPAKNDAINRGCMYALRTNLYEGFPIPSNPDTCFNLNRDYSAQGLQWSKDTIQSLIQTYKKLGYTLGSRPSDPTFHPLQNFILNEICSVYPAVCENLLLNECANKTVKQLAVNVDLMRFCGCFLSEAEIQHYTNIQVRNECIPTCNRPDTIKRTDQYGNCITCRQSLCLIDDVTISLINSSLGGSINISNFCGGR